MPAPGFDQLLDPTSSFMREAVGNTRPFRAPESFGQRLQRSEELDSTIVAWNLRRDVVGEEQEPVEGYNYLLDGNREGYEDFDHVLIEARSPGEEQRLKSLIDIQVENRRVLDEDGGGLATILAIAKDPVNWIPLPAFGIGKGAISAIRATSKVGARQALIGAGRGAVIGGVDSLVRNAFLDADPTRTDEQDRTELAFGVGMGAVFGSVYRYMKTGRAQGLLARAENEFRVGTVTEIAEREAKKISGEEISKLPGQLQSAAVRGALDQVDPGFKELVVPGSWIGRKMLGSAGLWSPAMRLSVGQVAEVRLFSQRMLNTPFLREGDAVGPAVESLIKTREGAAYVAIVQQDEIWKQFRKAGGREITRRRPFFEFVGKASRRDDLAHDLGLEDQVTIDAVQEAARSYRRFVNAITQDGIDSGVFQVVDLDEAAKGLKGTAPSWLTRMWNYNEVFARQEKLRQTITDWDVLENGATPREARLRAETAVQRILDAPTNTTPLNLVGERGPFKDRQLLIPDRLIEDFLEHDIRKAMVRLTNTLIPDIELAREFAPKLQSGPLGSLLRKFEDVKVRVAEGDVFALNSYRRRTNDLATSQRLRSTAKAKNEALADDMDGIVEARGRVDDKIGKIERERLAVESALDEKRGPLEQAAKETSKAAAPKTRAAKRAQAELDTLEAKLDKLSKDLRKANLERGRLERKLAADEAKFDKSVAKAEDRARGARDRLSRQREQEIATGRPVGAKAEKLKGQVDEAQAVLERARRLREASLESTRRDLRKAVAKEAKADPAFRKVEAKAPAKRATAKSLRLAATRAEKAAERAQGELNKLNLRTKGAKIQTAEALDALKAEQRALAGRAQSIRDAAKELAGTDGGFFSVKELDDVSPTTQRQIDAELSRAHAEAAEVRREVARSAYSGEHSINRVKRAYEDLATEAELAGDLKLATNLRKESERRVVDMEAIFGRARNLVGRPGDPASTVFRISRGVRKWNFITQMGGVVLSSIPDLAMGIFVNGFESYFRGMKFMLKDAIFNAAKTIKSDEMAKMVTAMEMVSSISRAKSLFDIADEVGRHAGPISKAMDFVSDKFADATLINRWNATLKMSASFMAQDRLLRTVRDLADGVELSSFHRNSLKLAGIDDDLAKKIAAQSRKWGEKDGGLLLSRTDLWDDAETKRLYQAAVLTDVDRTIVTPGIGDLPLFMDKEAGKLLLQFKSFSIAATNRVAISGLQRHDMAVASGMMSMVALGTVTYWIKEAIKGNELSDDIRQHIYEGVDRSGVLGIVAEFNGTAERLTLGQHGFGPYLGAEPLSRHSMKQWYSAVVGPGFGKVIDAGLGVQSLFAPGSFIESDVKRIKRMTPFQNLFYFSWLMDKLAFDPMKESLPTRRDQQ